MPVGTDPALEPLRLPVQYVIRPRTAEHPDYRGYAGRLASGMVRPGDEVVVLPSGRRTTVAGIDRAGATGEIESLDVAFAPQSVVLRLADDIDISRGDLIAAAESPGLLTRALTGTVAVLAERVLRSRDRVLLRVGTRTVRAMVEDIVDQLDIETMQQQPAPEGLSLNAIGRVTTAAGRGRRGRRLPRAAPHRRLPAHRRGRRLDPGRGDGRVPDRSAGEGI